MKILFLTFFSLFSYQVLANDRPLSCDACALVNGYSKKETAKIEAKLREKGINVKLLRNQNILAFHSCRDLNPTAQLFYITTRGGMPNFAQVQWTFNNNLFEYFTTNIPRNLRNEKWSIKKLEGLPQCQPWVNGETDYIARPIEW